MTELNIISVEPTEAFPYKPPTAELLKKYPHVFQLKETLPPRFFKNAFDKLVALFLIALSIPILLLLKLAFVIEGWLIPENKGPMLFYYNGVSAGKIIPKYKIRLIKTKYIEPEGAKRHDWIAFSAEWTPDSRTHVGQFVKKFYLDELPQFYNVLIGEMSLVGPRPERQFFIDQIVKTAPHYKLLHKIKPGITSWGQVKYGYAENVSEMIERLKYDLLYIENMSLMVDLKILIYTVLIVVQGRGK